MGDPKRDEGRELQDRDGQGFRDELKGRDGRDQLHRRDPDAAAGRGGAEPAHDADFAQEGQAVSQGFADSQGGEIDSDSERHTDPHGATLPQRGGQRMPQMPHERDQSSASQSKSEDPVTSVGAQGHEDLESGRVDTDRGPPMDELYGKELRPTGRGDKTADDPTRSADDRTR